MARTYASSAAEEGGVTVLMAPLPRLTWDGYGWAGAITLLSWKGFRVRGEGRRAASGRVPLEVNHAGDEVPRYLPSPEQIAAYEYLLAHEAAIARAALKAMLPYAKSAVAGTQYGPGAEPPALRKVDDLRGAMALSTVRLFYTTSRGVGYVGLGFGCAWDEEHGAGVVLHQRRVVTVGHASDSFDERIAEEDAAGK